MGDQERADSYKYTWNKDAPKSQTRREAGAESDGSYLHKKSHFALDLSHPWGKDSRAAEARYRRDRSGFLFACLDPASAPENGRYNAGASVRWM